MFGEPEFDDRFRELHLGPWEGLTRREIAERYPDEVAALGRGEDFWLDGSESLSEFVVRLVDGLDAVSERLDDGDHAVVVSHGGAIQVLTAAVLGLGRGRPALTIPGNGSTTTVGVEQSERWLSVFNDKTHLDQAFAVQEPGATMVLLIRHGETEANVARRWQGRGDGYLTREGERQVEELAALAPPVDRVFSSPSVRARRTAEALAGEEADEIGLVEEALEIDFGRWEGLTADEAAANAPAEYRRIYSEGEDLPRGGTGESFADAGSRMRALVDRLAASHSGGAVGLVTHGGATRALVSNVLGIGFGARRRLVGMRNTAIAGVEYGRKGPVLSTYNIAPHLDPG